MTHIKFKCVKGEQLSTTRAQQMG